MTPEPRLQVVEAPGTYIYFVLSAFAITLLAGPVIGLMLWAARSGAPFAGGETALIQAHGWTQLAGWAGLFVAGFSLRLIPRFAGRPEAPPQRALLILAALVLGVLGRDVAVMLAPGTGWIRTTSELAGAVGMLGVAISVTGVLRIDRRPGSAWALMAMLGAAWWLAWAAGSVGAGVAAASSGAVPYEVDRAIVWGVTLGAVGNFVWAVQTRMMPISFGRRGVSRSKVLGPAIAYNLGAALVVVGFLTGQVVGSGVWPAARLAGFGIAGICLAWLAAVCGALGGKPVRLRPASQPLGRFIVWANRWAVLAGVMLILVAIRAWLPSPLHAVNFEDAALHAMGAGLVTMLIAGMLQLVAPVFAMRRREPPERASLAGSVWLLLMVAALARVVAALLQSADAALFSPLAGISGLCGWLGLATLFGALLRARRRKAAVALS